MCMYTSQEQIVTTPPSHHREDSPIDYPPKDHPEALLGSKDGSIVPPADKTPHIPLGDPFSRFWSGQTADTDKRRPRWLIRKPERRHSVDLEELNKQDHRPYRYVLRRTRSSLPRPKFYSRYLNAKGVSFEYVGFFLQHIVQQWQGEHDKENIELEKRESEARRQSELPADLTEKPCRVIPVDPVISPFDSGEDKVPREDTLILRWPPEHPSTPDLVPKDTS